MHFHNDLEQLFWRTTRNIYSSKFNTIFSFLSPDELQDSWEDDEEEEEDSEEKKDEEKAEAKMVKAKPKKSLKDKIAEKEVQN